MGTTHSNCQEPVAALSRYGSRRASYALPAELPVPMCLACAVPVGTPQAFFYQVKLEAEQAHGLAVLNASIADIMM